MRSMSHCGSTADLTAWSQQTTSATSYTVAGTSLPQLMQSVLVSAQRAVLRCKKHSCHPSTASVLAQPTRFSNSEQTVIDGSSKCCHMKSNSSDFEDRQ